ncbi:DNA-binding protein HU, partial [Klebsiella pneumoniae]
MTAARSHYEGLRCDINYKERKRTVNKSQLIDK